MSTSLSPTTATASPDLDTLRTNALLAAFRLTPFRAIRLGETFAHPHSPTQIHTKIGQGRYRDAQGLQWATNGDTVVVRAPLVA